MENIFAAKDIKERLSKQAQEFKAVQQA